MSSGINPVVFIIGPTASGKTTLSLQLSQKIPSEIVSADSRQVYRLMNIGKNNVNSLRLVSYVFG